MCSFSASKDDDDKYDKQCDDFSSKCGEECDFGHEQACSITESVVFCRMCGAPVVTTQAGTKDAASTKQWVVAMLFGQDWCFRNLPVGVVSVELLSAGGFNYFKHLLKISLKPLGWS